MASTVDRPTRDALEREREFLLRSIEDLEAEHAAGDVGDEDYRLLREDYVARAAATLRALSEADPEASDPADRLAVAPRSSFRHFLGRARTRRVLICVGVVCVFGVVAIAAAAFAGVRFPGQSATGSVSLPRATQIRDDLSEATLLAGSGNEAEAVALYGQVLTLDPRNAQALAYRGWLVRLAGESAHSKKTIVAGDASIARAVFVAPSYPDARAFRAIALDEDDDEVAGAVSQVRAFVADRPPPALVAAVGGELAAIDERAGVRLPKVLEPYARST